MAKLKRELGLFHVTLAGIGIILGAGVYALIGVGAGETGNSLWLGFLVSTIVAAFTGLSYAELSSIFKKDAGEFDYANYSFGRKFAIFISFLIVIAGTVSAATISLGFAGYLSSLVPLNLIFGALILVVLLTALNFYGIKESSTFNIIATSIEFLGLAIIVFLGIGSWGNVDLFEMSNGFIGVFKSGALLFFAFMGFEMIIKFTEETKNPTKTIPLAILISIFITAIFYVLVAISAVSILPAEQLAASDSPLADVAALSFGKGGFLFLTIIALFATANSVLITMITGSRTMYGIAQRKALPKIFSEVHKTRGTPHYSVFIFGGITAILALIGDIKLVADITTILLFFIFASINLCAIVLRYKSKRKADFRMPVNIGKFPVIALLGVLSSIVMLVFSLMNILG